MSHIEKEVTLPKHVIVFDAAKLKKLRKVRILWELALYGTLAVWMISAGLFMPQGLLQAVLMVVMLWPLVYIGINHLVPAYETFAKMNTDAQFVHRALMFFENVMRGDESVQNDSRYVDIDVSMSSRKPGVLDVKVFGLLDASSRPHDPQLAPMVFEVSSESFISYSAADPLEVMRLLSDAVSTDVTTRQHGKELEKYFVYYPMPVTSTTPMATSGMHGD